MPCYILLCRRANSFKVVVVLVIVVVVVGSEIVVSN